VSLSLATRLVEPDFWTCPHGKRTRPDKTLTYGPLVADFCAKIGFAPDPQQELGLDLIFAIKADGSPASFEFCVICCRQNLKTGLFKQTAMGWLFVTEQPLIVWSAHEMSTTSEARRELGDLMLGSPHTRRHMMANKNDGIYDANGSERIELANGQRILFKARTESGGRGLAAPKLILDEAFALKASMLGALIPLMAAQIDPQVLYGSSAGKADSVALRDIRERGRRAMSPEMSYLEWLSEKEPCADEHCRHPKDAASRGMDCALDREHLILAANPTISTGRIRVETIRNFRQALPPEEYMRECLGWWDDVDVREQPIDVVKWTALAEDVMPPDGPPDYFALTQSPDRIGYIAVGFRVGGASFVDIAEAGRVDDSSKIVDWFKQRRGRGKRVVVAIDSRDPAAAYVNELRAAKIRVNVTTQSDSVRACGGLESDVESKTVQHIDQPIVRKGFESAKKRMVGKAGQWEFDLDDPTPEVAAVRAITLARYGLTFKKARTGSGTKRSAVVLS
jgi:hypothetical protein